MTVAAQATAVGYTGNGVTTVFAYTMRILDSTYLKVYVNGVLQVGGYTVSGVNNLTGGNVTFAVAPANGAVILFQRQTAQDQQVDYTPYDAFPSETHETALDKLTMLVQEGIAGATSAIRIPPNEATTTQLPSAALRASQFVAFDAVGNVIVAVGAASVPVSAFMATVLDDVDAGTAIATIVAALSAEAAPAIDDLLVMYDTSEAKGNKMRFDDFFKVVALLTQKTKPVRSADFLPLYDVAGTAGKKVLIDDLPLPMSEMTGNMANNAVDAVNDIDIAAGRCRSITDTDNIIQTGALTKQLDAAWAVGNNAGMRASGAAIANTTYHIFRIKRPDTGVVDIAADTSASGANIAANTNANYTEIRRIGSIIRSGGAILAFVQDGDFFQWNNNTTADWSLTSPGITAVTRAVLVPGGIRVLARLKHIMSCAGAVANVRGLLSDLQTTDIDPSSSSGNVGGAFNVSGTMNVDQQVDVRTDTSSQIRTRYTVSDINHIYTAFTIGWFDRRDRG